MFAIENCSRKTHFVSVDLLFCSKNTTSTRVASFKYIYPIDSSLCILKKNNLECKFIFWHEFRTKNTFVLSPYRLPIIQGATAAFLMPVFALMSQPEWRCPFDDEANGMNLLIFCNKYTLSVNTHGGIEIRLHRCLRTLSTLHFRFRPQG